ncbi:SDR family NAD(P)-dependent oxidoreductase [Cryobacterium sp. TMT1-2-1]|uniref:SDR family NAD(P)-dependent oxidoreductase n=1 Tax=Cryobacterium sp. TMT1-2-1 TaxID=1259232 RepID=UPI00106CA2AB|nr:SDR family NAD(P)-dependent oxidoreductase [Cryobacterium sp. TMT1-2-1]
MRIPRRRTRVPTRRASRGRDDAAEGVRTLSVVVTGASSGIGRATALALARRGTRLVLAARSASSLDEVAAECRSLGGEAIAVPTDVADPDQISLLAATAIERFTSIRGWVSAAGVYAAGSVEETPDRIFRRVLEVNLLGQVYGARAALPALRRTRGTLVLLGSVFSRVPAPMVSAYVASKHAVLGFAECLRLELLGSGVRVCTILPSTTDTPIYIHAANRTGRVVHPMPPLVSPDRVAAAIVRRLEHPRPTTVVGRTQGLGIPLRLLARPLYDRLIVAGMMHLGLRADGIPDSDGTVFEPDPASNTVDGGWRQRGGPSNEQ